MTLTLYRETTARELSSPLKEHEMLAKWEAPLPVGQLHSFLNLKTIKICAGMGTWKMDQRNPLQLCGDGEQRIIFPLLKFPRFPVSAQVSGSHPGLI